MSIFTDPLKLQYIFGFATGLTKIVWQQEITDEFLRSIGLPPNTAIVDLIMKVDDPTSVSDSNAYGVGYLNAETVEKGQATYLDGTTYALRGITVRKGDILFVAGDTFAHSVRVSVEAAGTPLPAEQDHKTGPEAFGGALGKALGNGTILLIAAILIFGQTKKAIVG